MKALLVEEVINFKRSDNPLSSMKLGGLSFDTLQPGAILKAKRYFGVTAKSGNITGFHSGSIKISNGSYLLVTDIGDNKVGGKIISFKRYGSDLNLVKDEKNILKDKGKQALQWWGVPNGSLSGITKNKFDYRLEIIEPGFHMDESLDFERRRDPKTSIGIGRGPAQHIDEFERILNMCSFEYERDESPDFPDVITWVLIDADFGPLKDKTVFLHKARNRSGGIGWHFRPYSASYFDDPYAILTDIINGVYEDMNTEIEAMKDSLIYYKNRISTIKEVERELKP